MAEFREFALVCQKLEKEGGKKEKARMIGEFFRSLSPEEAKIASYLFLGRFPAGKRIFVSWNILFESLKEMFPISPKEMERISTNAVDVGDIVEGIYRRWSKYTSKGLTISEVYDNLLSLDKMEGKGAMRYRKAILKGLLTKMDSLEARYLAKVIVGEMRIGVKDGMILEGLATAVDVPLEEIRKGYLLYGDIGETVRSFLEKKEKTLESLSLTLFQPLQPMLAQMAYSIKEAFEEIGGELALEFKYDGARVQIHKGGDKVMIFSRRLNDLTPSFPEIVEEVRKNIKGDVILEGEVVAVKEGKFLPFQDILRRVSRRREIERMREEIPLKLFLFDCLYVDGESLLDVSYEERWKKLEEIAGGIPLAERILPKDLEEGESFFKRALEAGAEGVMAKALKGIYTPGNRGKLWLKVKKSITLDLVIIGAEWGYGRRHNWLSDYHLACWDKERKELLMVGKTFKGLTDQEFEEMTKKLLELKIREEGGVVYVRPEVVVEVAFNDVQRSPKYKCGYALRLARIVRIRDDKKPEEADDITAIERIFKAE
ncbi:ATP-dependent DNA ligase [bacterium]|nr:ATP-dependent DNA ligase [bacterium]